MDVTKFFEHMLYKQGKLSGELNDWVIQPKLDGIRASFMIDKDKKYFRIQGRDNYNKTMNFPEFNDAIEHIDCKSVILDGEIVQGKGLSANFHDKMFRKRIALKDPHPSRVKLMAKLNPLNMVFFDIVYLDGKDLTGLSAVERTHLLEETVSKTNRLGIIESVFGKPVEVYEHYLNDGFEGIMIKEPESKYEIGKRVSTGLKIKPTLEGVFEIDSKDPINEGKGHRKRLGSINILENGKRLGDVGSGLSERLIDYYFKHKPKKIKVAYQERTPDGHLRFPRVVGYVD